MAYSSRPAFIVLLFSAVALPACGGTAEREGAQTPQVTAETVAHMHQHFDRVRHVEEAVIRGDLEGAQEPARWLAEHQELAGAAASSGPYISEMRTAAQQVASAGDIGTAARGAAQLAAACGNCHAASKVAANLPDAMVPASADDRAGHMREHQAAVDLLYRGLAAPSDEQWKKGAEMLRHAPLAAEDLGDIQKEAQASEARVHELAGRALTAAHQDSRVTVYAELVGTCASCHGLHGKVWGPGVPRAE